MRAATVVQVLQDLSFIACFILLVIAPLRVNTLSTRPLRLPACTCI